MAKVFELLGNKGLVETTNSGYIPTATGITLVNTVKGGAFYFPTVSGRINLATNQVKNTTTMTYELWFLVKSGTLDQGFYGNSLHGSGLTLRYNKNVDAFNLYGHDGANKQAEWTSTKIKIGQWNHVVITRNGASASMYTNGQFISTVNTLGTTEASYNNAVIGNRSLNDYAPTGGYLGGIRVFNTTLSRGDINKLYNAYLSLGPVNKPRVKRKTIPETLNSGLVNTQVVVTNAGGPSTTDFLDSNADGLADNITGGTVGGNSIVTGNGFTGNAQRSVGNFTTLRMTTVSTAGETFRVTGKYRSSGAMQVKSDASVIISLPANTGNAIAFDCTGTLGLGNLLFQGTTGASSWIEIDEIQVTKYTGLVAAYNGTIINGKAINIAPPSAANANNPTAYDGTCTKVLPTADGLYFNGASSNIAVTDDNRGPFSICLYVKSDTGNTQMVSRGAGDIYFTCGISGATYGGRVETGTIKTVTTTGTLNAFTFNTVVLTYDGAFMNIYVNGIFSTQTAQTGTVADTGNLNIGSYQNSASWFKGYMKDIRYYNRAITATEVKNYHNSFMKPVLVEDFSNYKVGVINAEGIIKVSGAYLIDTTRPRTNLSINNDLTKVFGIGWSVDATMTGTIVADGPAGTPYTFCAEATTPTGGAAQRLFNSYPSTSSTKKYSYSFWAKSVSGNTTLSQNNLYNSTETLTTSWQKFSYVVIGVSSGNTRLYIGGAGTFRVTGVEIKEVVDPIKDSNNYLELANSTACMPNLGAYGTWEFDMYYAAAASAPSFFFINTGIKSDQSTLRGVSGYSVIIDGSGRIRFRESANLASGNDLFLTTTNYVATYTWYLFRVTRSAYNVFTVYIKGGVYTNWTIISTAGGSGTNPITSTLYPTSSVMIFQSASTGAKITNIKYTPGILA